MVLVADDEESIRSSLQQLLEQAGYKAVTAATGDQALEAASRREFEVALLDIRMPGLTGLEVLHALQEKHRDVGVIMLTAVAEVETVIDAMKNGAYDYVVKPFRAVELLVRVERARERRRLLLDQRSYQRRLEQEVEEQRARLQEQFAELVQSLAREHATLYELEALRSQRGGRDRPMRDLPSELQKPAASVQDFAAALLRLVREGKLAPQQERKRYP
jgi:DNA-binding NtrC family response regulator